MTAAPRMHPIARLDAALARPDRKGAVAALAVSAVTGALMVLATAELDIWPLGWVAVTPLLWAVDRAPTRRRALLCGWTAGLAANAGGFYWIVTLLAGHGGLPLPLAILGLLLLCAYQALVFLLFAAAVRGLRRLRTERGAPPLPMALIAPLALVTFEVLVPFLFPWFLAITQAWVPPVIQIAELTGPVGVSAILAAAGGAIYDAARGPTLRRRLVPVAATAVAIGAVLIYGAVRMAAVDARRERAPTLLVGVVQSNIPMHGVGGVEAAQIELAALQRASAELEARGAQLLVWPETSYPFGIPRALETDVDPQGPGRIRRGFTAPLVFGAITTPSDRDAAPYNSALMLEGDGRLTGRYDKIHLLLFGESIPGVETFPWLRDLLPASAGHLSSGEEVTTFSLEVGNARYRLGPMICYEDILPRFGRRLGALHPHLLVNLTNDAWFGDTAEHAQHLALSVFRAVELRTDMVRAVNTGISAVVDAAGRVRARTTVTDPDPTVPATRADPLLAEVALVEGGHTFYARFGDVFGYLCVAATLGPWLLSPWLRRRRPRRAR